MENQTSSEATNNKFFACQLCNTNISTTDEMRTHLFLCASKTEQCSACKKYVTRDIFAYHTAHACTNPPDLSNQELISSRKLTDIHEKTNEIKTRLKKHYYDTEIDHITESLQFSIIVIGSPRVGKSQLINALCDGRTLAETSNSLNSCTQKVTEYVLQDKREDLPSEKRFKIKLFDTPGIESWTNNGGVRTMIKFIEDNNPLCVIYCASPGSFAKTEQLNEVLLYCKDRGIFCALVCTNMWSNSNRNAVMEDFEESLKIFGTKDVRFSDQRHTSKPHKVTFFGMGALCTMVNSIEYQDEELCPEPKPIQGIDELVHGIMECLQCEKLLGWCYAVLNKRTYWEKVTQKINGFFSSRRKEFDDYEKSSPLETAASFFSYYYDKLFKTKK